MLINSREQLKQEIAYLQSTQLKEKDKLLQQLQAIEQMADPVYLLKKKLAKVKDRIPRLFDNFIDQSFSSGTQLLKDKVGLNRESFITKAADNLVQKKINHFYEGNRYKIKSIAVAIAKNIFR
jgi:hypothetical protein